VILANVFGPDLIIPILFLALMVFVIIQIIHWVARRRG
jgi:hypothetical protein